MDRNMPTTALYYRLIDQLKGSGYKRMQYISNNILNLPIHQDITEQDLKDLSNEILKFYESN